MTANASPSDRGAAPLDILIIDDDDLDRLAVRRSLMQSGMSVSTDEVAAADDVLRMLAARRYDCILLDYYLPGVDGLGLLAQIRDAAPRTPVVIFTGRGDEDVAVELMKSGAADYLPKSSLSSERLAAGIRHALEVQRVDDARRRAESLLRLLSDAAQHLLTAADPSELVSGLLEKVEKPLGVDAYLNYLADESGARYVLTSWAGISAEGVPAELAEAPDLMGALAERREHVHVPHVQRSDDPLMKPLKQLGIRALSYHPLLAEYRLLGALCFASRGKDEFSADEIEFLATVSHYATAAYERLRHIEQLRDSDRRKDEFLATLAHELRDPLSPLRNMVEVMKRSDSGEVLRAARVTMERQLGQLERLVDDLLDVSRITRSRLELRRRRVALSDVVQQAVEAASPLIERCGHELRLELADEVIHVHADPVRLAQVLGNLLTNASKYTEGRGRIVLTARRHRAEAVVSVRDNGIGIPRDKLESVFDMFSQVHPALERSQGGLGIGLTLVKRLVLLHGGQVEARSEGPGRGSEFIVRLPLAANEPQSAAPETSAAAAEGSARRILVVDDNLDSAASLAMLLQAIGHTTEQANDGMEAFEAAERFKPDMILLDIGLPKLNGYEVCRRIREQPWGGGMLIVALSGWGQDEDRRQSSEAGFDRHLVKPVAYTDLIELLKEAPAGNAPA